MTTFITIMRLNDGLASYEVNESKGIYKAQLLRSTSHSELPSEIKIAGDVNDRGAHNLVMMKLIQAIRTAENNQE